jgi:hypothetical protein
LDKAEAMAIVRGLIERITLTPGEDGGLAVVLHGDLARIMQLCEAGERIIGGCGACFGHCFPWVARRLSPSPWQS